MQRRYLLIFGLATFMLTGCVTTVPVTTPVPAAPQTNQVVPIEVPTPVYR